MSHASFQQRLDQLVGDLDLTIEEREWIHAGWRTDRVACRVVNLLDEVVKERPFDKRQVLLRHLFEAVQAVRAAMAAERFVPPEGYVVVREDVLEALRELAVVQARFEGVGPTDPSRAALSSRRSDSGRTVLHVDPVVAQMVEGLS
jgi:hypothetical protein